MDRAIEDTGVDRLPVVMASAVLTSTCLLPAMLMPYLVGAVALTVTPDSRQLGFVAAAVLGGPIALMAASVLWVRRYPWRRLVFGGLALAAVGYLLAAGARDFATLIAWIALGSSALAIAYAPPICLLSDTSDPDRNFGYAFFLQIIASGLVGLAVTALQGRLGPRSVFILIAAAFAASLALLPRIPQRGVKVPARSVRAAPSSPPGAPDPRAGKPRGHHIWMGLAGMLLLNAGPTAVWAFFEQIGRGAGFTEQSVGNMIAIALLLGAPGSLFSGAAARRYGRIRPLAASTLLLVVTFGIAIHAHSPVIYFLAATLFQFLLNFGLSFQYGALSDADTSGRLIVLAPTFQGIGGIGGPIIAGLLAHGGSYVAVGAWSAVYEITGLALLVALCTRGAAGRSPALPITPR
jgi:predicted MFS family arabinose efflux permease